MWTATSTINPFTVSITSRCPSVVTIDPNMAAQPEGGINLYPQARRTFSELAGENRFIGERIRDGAEWGRGGIWEVREAR